MRRAAFLGLGCVSIFLACSNNPVVTPDGGDGGPTDAKKETSLPDTFVPLCEDVKMCDDPMPPAMSQCVVSFDTSMVDVNAMPITTEKLFFCGTNICTSPLKPDAQGKIHEYICTYFVKGAAKFLGGTKYASFSSAVPMQQAAVLPALTLIALPAMGVDIPMGGGAVTSNMVTLDVAASSVTFDPTEPDDMDLHRFRAVQVPLAKAPPGTPANVEVLWGLGPVNAALKPAAKLTVPNVLSWPASSTVQFFLNGSDAFNMVPVAPYGGWGPIGIGHVDAQGMTISTDTGVGNGLPMIGMVGLHKM